MEGDFKVGEYFDTRVQIDVVAIRSDNVTELGECKWGRVRSVPALRSGLDDKVKLFSNRRGATVTRRHFSSSYPRTFARNLASAFTTWRISIGKLVGREESIEYSQLRQLRLQR